MSQYPSCGASKPMTVEGCHNYFEFGRQVRAGSIRESVASRST